MYLCTKTFMRLIDFHISSRVRYKRRDNKTLVNAGLLEMLNSTGKMRHCIFFMFLFNFFLVSHEEFYHWDAYFNLKKKSDLGIGRESY